MMWSLTVERIKFVCEGLAWVLSIRTKSPQRPCACYGNFWSSLLLLVTVYNLSRVTETSGVSFAAHYGKIRCIFYCLLRKRQVYLLLLVKETSGMSFAARYGNVRCIFCCALWKRLVYQLLVNGNRLVYFFAARYGNVLYSFRCMLWKRLVHLRCFLWMCLARLFFRRL